MNVTKEWVRVDKDRDSAVSLKGITIEVDRSDSTLNSVTITDESGSVIRFKNNSYGQMGFETPKGPELVSGYRVTGFFNGVQVNRVFTGRYDAQQWARAFGENNGDIRIKEEKFLETELPVAEGKVIDVPKDDDDIPF